MIDRGDRRLPRLDLATADWQCNEFGVDVLMRSSCAVTGAFTMAPRYACLTP